MAIKIGHASIDERGKATGGVAGDGTKKEVCVRNWYNGGWHTVLRPKNSTLAEKSAKACEAACANDNIGYDQNQRNTLNTQAKQVGYDLEKITTPCECDCSALMHVCAIAGGANLSYGSNGVTTSTMVNVLVASGDYEKFTDSKYLTSDRYLKRGDILVKTGHTAMALENGSAAADQNTTQKKDTATVYYSVRLPLLKRGSEGKAVKNMQNLLIDHGEKLPDYGADGDFGKETGDALESFQRKNGLTPDRECGQKTWLALITT